MKWVAANEGRLLNFTAAVIMVLMKWKKDAPGIASESWEIIRRAG